MTKKYILKFDGDLIGEPILAECILKTGALINILKADASGNILIRFDKEREKEVLSYLRGRGVETSELKNAVVYDKNKCIDCGACISLCPTSAFCFDKTVKLEYDEEKCVLCRTCIDACPVRALKQPEA
ncbi:MAG: 4Fe-4S binding protein [Candidatus Altiarchaeota archaeon]|nr:4Fe-4S binding protein [Candidatus Altiarchaeota archaeon]